MRRTFQERTADAIVSFSGCLSFLTAHTLWFGLWLLLNTGRFGVHPFDPFPYSLLTMIVSLETVTRPEDIMAEIQRRLYPR